MDVPTKSQKMQLYFFCSDWALRSARVKKRGADVVTGAVGAVPDEEEEDDAVAAKLVAAAAAATAAAAASTLVLVCGLLPCS